MTEMLRSVLRAAPALKATTAQLLMLETYETTYGIHRHTEASSELALVAMHPAEDTMTGSPLYERIEQFIEKEVGEAAKLSLTEFLDLPSDMCDFILEVANRRLTEKAKMNADLAKQADIIRRSAAQQHHGK